jgi:hypothetical protein
MKDLEGYGLALVARNDLARWSISGLILLAVKA